MELLQKKGSFHVIGIPLPCGVFSRYLYVKKYYVKSESEESDKGLVPNRTLYVSNLPREFTKKNVKELFEEVGATQLVVLLKREENDAMNLSCSLNDRKLSVAVSALVVFKSEDSLDSTLKIKSLGRKKKNDTIIPTSPVEAIIQKYNEQYPGLDVLQKEADKVMREYELKEEQALKDRERLAKTVDDDGFQTVVNVRSKRDVEEIAPIRNNKKKESKELQNFYRFQMREEKRQKLHKLREQFMKDQAKIEEMKRSRRFKPE